MDYEVDVEGDRCSWGGILCEVTKLITQCCPRYASLVGLIVFSIFTNK